MEIHNRKPEKVFKSRYISCYKGIGKLFFNDGSHMKCEFETLQLNRGSIVLFCYYTPNNNNAIDYFTKFFEVTGFEGNAEGTEMQKICATGSMHYFTTSEGWKQKNDVDKQVATFRLDKLKVIRSIKEPARENVKWLSFGITNFGLFNPDLRNIVLNLALRVFVEKRKVIIAPLEKFKEIQDEIKITRGVNVTSEIKVPIDSEHEIETVTDEIDDICLLLSIAQGCRVNWLYRDTFTEGWQRIERLHGDRVVRNYTSMPLIAPLLKAFIEKTYPTYKERNKSWLLSRGVVGGYLEAKQESDLLETRAMKAVTSMERIRTVREYGNTKFKDGIRKILDDLGLSFDENDIGLFVKCRNSLVHDGYFYCKQKHRHKPNYPPLKSDFEEYLFIMHFMDRIILKIIGYSGYYVDCRKQGWKTYEKLAKD